jgi:hypothetical protein
MELLDPQALRYVLDRMIGEARRYGHSFSVVHMLLPEEDVVAGVPRLRRALRDADVLGRWTDEALVALLPATDLDGAEYVAQRLRETVREIPMLSGAAEWSGETPQELLRRAAWAGARP